MWYRSGLPALAVLVGFVSPAASQVKLEWTLSQGDVFDAETVTTLEGHATEDPKAKSKQGGQVAVNTVVIRFTVKEVTDNTSSQAAGTVVSQDPVGNTMVNPGSQVSSRRELLPCTVEPDRPNVSSAARLNCVMVSLSSKMMTPEAIDSSTSSFWALTVESS